MTGAAPPHLPGIFHGLEPALNHYGYLAVAGFVLLEDFGVPVPGETILILGAVYAGTGRLNVILVGILAFLAAVTGATSASRSGTSAAGASWNALDATSCSLQSDLTKPPGSLNATAPRS